MALPEIGEPLPRAADAWVDDAKWTGWILAARGHGREWQRVVAGGAGDELWLVLAAGVRNAPVTELRDLGAFGVTCRVPLLLPFGANTIAVRTIWHYADGGAAPRLVTAYPAT